MENSKTVHVCDDSCEVSGECPCACAIIAEMWDEAYNVVCDGICPVHGPVLVPSGDTWVFYTPNPQSTQETHPDTDSGHCVSCGCLGHGIVNQRNGKSVLILCDECQIAEER